MTDERILIQYWKARAEALERILKSDLINTSGYCAPCIICYEDCKINLRREDRDGYTKSNACVANGFCHWRPDKTLLP